VTPVLGWDIGGVNTKVARVADGAIVAARARPFEIQREPGGLASVLVELAAGVGHQLNDAHAVTMTAELSQVFRTKREGVCFVLDQVATAFPEACIRVYNVGGHFVERATARDNPLAVAAANWSATAHFVARRYPDAVLMDVGSTTTDVIPISAGTVAARGRTDPERLREGELVYTGALRTPVEAIASTVPLWGAAAGVAAEGFAQAGDVHLWRGDLAPGDYSAPTPDGRPATRSFAGERLARVVCADRDMLDEQAINAIADRLWEAQVERIEDALVRVARRVPGLKGGAVVVTGLGAFLAAAAAERAGLRVAHLADHLGAAARHAAAATTGLLCAEVLEREAIRQ
jgi:probable H4MPT-linked C1 transfer pathway protein